MQNLLFIVNPIAGKGAGIQTEKKIAQYFKQSHIEIYRTKGVGDGYSKAKRSLEKNYQAIIAVGGDGTVHEVGKALVGSTTPLGIVPIGSGNGLALELSIRNFSDACTKIENMKSMAMDVGMINNQMFLNIAGIGYDAEVAFTFSRKSKRGFLSYINSILGSYSSRKEKVFTVEHDGKLEKHKAILAAVANGTQYGNDACIAPKSSIQDQQLDLVFLKKIPLIASLKVIYQLFSKNIHKSTYWKAVPIIGKAKTTHEENFYHLDGEPYEGCPPSVEISILPKALRVLV